jgi:hypothetical protein
MDSLINPQLESKFFAVPAEIRYIIYAYLVPQDIHIFLKKGKLNLSPCVQRGSDNDPNSALKRRTVGLKSELGPWVEDPIYAARLRSLWAEHWRCEDVVTGNVAGNEDDDGGLDRGAHPLMVVCKQMYVSSATT